MTSLQLVALACVAVCIAAAFFFVLRRQTNRIDHQDLEAAFIKSFPEFDVGLIVPNSSGGSVLLISKARDRCGIARPKGNDIDCRLVNAETTKSVSISGPLVKIRFSGPLGASEDILVDNENDLDLVKNALRDLL